MTRSCPAIIRRLLLAHELGRVLGLPVDNKHCSLMNSHAVSDGLTYVVPAKCSRKHPPSWISRLIDPRTAALARLIYTAPPAPAPLALSVDPTGVPSVTWVEPAGSAAASIVVARTATACPTDRDVAAGTVTTVYRAAPSAGSHSVVDSSFPRTGENDCYRAFALNRWGRASLSSDAISYTFGGPIASFAAEAAAAGAATTFTDASTAQHSSIARWTWNFGDPSSGAANTLDTTNPAVGQHPSHVYATAGTLRRHAHRDGQQRPHVDEAATDRGSRLMSADVLLAPLLAAAAILVLAGAAKEEPAPAIRFAAALGIPRAGASVRAAAVVEILERDSRALQPRPAAIAIALLYAFFTGLGGSAAAARRRPSLRLSRRARGSAPSRLHLWLNGACACIGCVAAVAPPPSLVTYAAAQPLSAVLVGFAAVVVALLSQAGLDVRSALGAWQGGRA